MSMCVYLGSVRGGRFDEQFCGEKRSETGEGARGKGREVEQGRRSKKKKSSLGFRVYCVFVVVPSRLVVVVALLFLMSV